MPASTQIADDDVHNHPGISQIPDEDVHNHPSANPDDPTPLVSPTQIDPNDVPEFERPIAASANLAPDEEDGTSVAYSVGNKPKQIDIVEPNKYTSGVQAHELVHLAQYPAGDENTVDPSGLSAIKDPAKRHAAIDNMYGYGGTEGLDKIMKSGGISKLNDEQQASIPQNYMKEYAKAVKSGDTKTIDRLNEVYQPAIKQLRNMANPSTDTIDTTPDAPAGAPASLLGLAKPVKGMASNSTKSADLTHDKNEPLIKGKSPEDEPSETSYARNKDWAKPGPYLTKLSPTEESGFQKWVKDNKVNWREGEKGYDMRGFYRAMQNGEVKMQTNKSGFDNKIHYTDRFKTPYDATFSRESQWAKPNAPAWDNKDRLVRPDGQVIVDEGYKPKKSSWKEAASSLGRK